MASRQLSLSVNNTLIVLDDFVQGYIDHVVGGILTSLKGTETIKSVALSIEGDQVSIVLNNAVVPINPFVTRIIKNTMAGVVSSLQGVSTMEKMQLNIKKIRGRKGKTGISP